MSVNVGYGRDANRGEFAREDTPDTVYLPRREGMDKFQDLSALKREWQRELTVGFVDVGTDFRDGCVRGDAS